MVRELRTSFTDTLWDGNESDSQRNGKTEEVCFKRRYIPTDSRKNHCRRTHTGTQKRREEPENADNHKKHSGLKQNGNDMQFNIARGHWEPVPAIQLHKWRKNGHQHH